MNKPPRFSIQTHALLSAFKKDRTKPACPFLFPLLISVLPDIHPAVSVPLHEWF